MEDRYKFMYNINSNYSSNVKQKNNPRFGALYMDEALITKRFGFTVGYAAKKTRPALEEIGKVVDVFVDPIFFGKNSPYNHLAVAIKRITQIAPKSKNPIKNCFNGIKEFLQINFIKKTFEDFVLPSDNIGDSLVKNADKLKETCLKSNK